jgi:hypothetical protein
VVEIKFIGDIRGNMYFGGWVKSSKKVVDDTNLIYFIIRYRSIDNAMAHGCKQVCFIILRAPQKVPRLQVLG